jgi:cystine transport system substrate-binding protein
VLPDDKLVQLMIGLSGLIASSILVVGHRFGLRRAWARGKSLTKESYAQTRFSFVLVAGAAGAALPASAADLLATVKARGTLKVAMEGTYPPFNYKEKERRAGRLCRCRPLLGQKLGLKVEFVSSEWASILAGLAANKYDVIISQVGINPKREQAFDFSQPYIYSMPQLIVRKDDKADYKSLADLKGKKLGVGQGSVYEQQAKAVPGMEVRSYAAAPDTMADLASGRIDAALNDSLMSAYLLKTPAADQGRCAGRRRAHGHPFQKGNPHSSRR